MLRHIEAILRFGERSDVLIVCIAGILAPNAKTRFAPLAPTLRLYDTLYLSYRSVRSGRAVSRDIAQAVKEYGSHYQTIILFGESLGGMKLPEAVRCLKQDPEFDTGKLSGLVPESPSGGRDFYGLVNRLGARFAWLMWALKGIFAKLLVPPKPANFEPWQASDAARYYDFLERLPTSEEERNEMIVAHGIKNLRASISTWRLFWRHLSQVSWMAWGSYFIPWRELRDIPTVYVACTSSANETLIQLQAALRWHELTDCEIHHMTVGAHNAFAERTREWNLLISQIIRDLIIRSIAKSNS